MFLAFQQGAVWNIKLYSFYGSPLVRLSFIFLKKHSCTVNDCSMGDQAFFHNLQGHATDGAQTDLWFI